MKHERKPQVAQETIGVVEAAAASSQGGVSPISIEVVLYLLIIAIAAVLRFVRLDLWPLLSEELTHVLPPLQLIKGNAPLPVDYSPLLFTTNFVTFLSLGPGDATARLLVALCGTILVALPYYLRSTLGRIGSLATSLILAFSPTFLYFSRTSVGSMIVATCAMVFLTALLAYQRDASRRHLSAAVAALAVALLAGSEVYTLILVGATLLGIVALSTRSSKDRSEYHCWLAMGREAVTDRGLIALFLAIMLLVATAFTWNLGGIQAGLNLLANWFSDLRPLAGGRSWYYYLRLLVIYESPVLILGLIGLGLSIRRREFLGLALGYWFVVALLFYTLLGPVNPGAMTVIILPLALLSGCTIEEGGQKLRSMGSWDVTLAGISVPILGFAYLNLVTYLHTGVIRSAWVGAIIIGLLAASMVVFWAWIGREEGGRAGIMVVLLILAIVQVKTSVRLNYQYARHPVEPLVIEPLSPDQREMVTQLTQISSHYSGDQHEIDILAEEGLRPVLSWCLRDFPNLDFAYSIPADATQAVVIKAVTDGDSKLATYAGTTFRLRSRWPQQTVTLRDRLRWLVLNEAIGVLQWDDIKLWVRMTKG